MQTNPRTSVLTINEAAKYLRVSVSILYRRYPEVPHFRIGRRILFTEAALEKFTNAQGDNE